MIELHPKVKWRGTRRDVYSRHSQRLDNNHRRMVEIGLSRQRGRSSREKLRLDGDAARSSRPATEKSRRLSGQHAFAPARENMISKKAAWQSHEHHCER